ncbi:hypothetical protein C8A01DRAFT_41126 [Parachaetomium inaequale]|uniref:Inosine/uridine-preferring nucleoside hydrolase domain-containing protein n=1 Tax=Parachaetomium inaequale TaxID=2588326 RepID=A0AAN6P7U7_9PEZI|nr:hypothetical protein C8A01DRAFT_41126 [Parachaetomium inaequale]
MSSNASTGSNLYRAPFEFCPATGTNQQRPTTPPGTPTSGRSTPGAHSGSPQRQKLPSQQGTNSNPPAQGASNPQAKGPGAVNTQSNHPGAPGPSFTPPPIPFKKDEPGHKEHHKICMDLVQLLKDRKGQGKPRIFVITDIEQDYDDLLAIIFLAEMQRMGAIQLVGFVANHEPAEQRAKFLRTVLRLLDLGSVPIAAGTRGLPVDKHHSHSYYELKNTTFRDQDWNEGPETARVPKGKRPGQALMEQVLEPNLPITALMLSSLQDIGEFFTRKEETGGNFTDHNFAKCVSQGGYTVEAPTPGNATGTATQQRNAKPGPAKSWLVHGANDDSNPDSHRADLTTFLSMVVVPQVTTEGGESYVLWLNLKVKPA